MVKKLIFSALLLAGLAGCSYQTKSIKPEIKEPSKKLELKVGMQMPKPTKGMIGTFIGPDFFRIDYGDKEHIEMIELYQACANQKNPFIAYYPLEGNLYIDNKDKKGFPKSDTIIDDKVYYNENLILGNFAPGCPQEL